MQSRKPAERCVGRTSVLIAIRLYGRSRAFRRKDVIIPLLQMLRETLAGGECSVEAYSFLNCELRLMLIGESESARPRRSFLEFKDKSESWLRGNNLPGWQSTFFSREIPDEAEFDQAIESILSEPSRRSLSPRLCQSPYVGTRDTLPPG